MKKMLGKNEMIVLPGENLLPLDGISRFQILDKVNFDNRGYKYVYYRNQFNDEKMMKLGPKLFLQGLFMYTNEDELKRRGIPASDCLFLDYNHQDEHHSLNSGVALTSYQKRLF